MPFLLETKKTGSVEGLLLNDRKSLDGKSFLKQNYVFNCCFFPSFSKPHDPKNMISMDHLICIYCTLLRTVQNLFILLSIVQEPSEFQMT